VVLDVVRQARAENTVDALRRSVGLKAQALRDDEDHGIPVDRLVPGDVVELKAETSCLAIAGCSPRAICSSIKRHPWAPPGEEEKGR
jgi:hypothetical protein